MATFFAFASLTRAFATATSAWAASSSASASYSVNALDKFYQPLVWLSAHRKRLSGSDISAVRITGGFSQLSYPITVYVSDIS